MRLPAILLALLAFTACGTNKATSPSDVVRAWSAALDRNDNETAGGLFAVAAEVIQDGSVITLPTHAAAVHWNSLLPCGGKITALELHGKDQVVAVFDLDERPGHRCDAPGAQAAALFEVHDGKIVVWHQTDVPTSATTGELA